MAWSTNHPYTTTIASLLVDQGTGTIALADSIVTDDLIERRSEDKNSEFWNSKIYWYQNFDIAIYSYADFHFTSLGSIYGIQNPCNLEVELTMEDINRKTCETTPTIGSATSYQLANGLICTGTISDPGFLLQVVIVTNEFGLPMTPTIDYIQVEPGLDQFSSSLTDVSKIGQTFTVQYKAGLSNESQFEIDSRYAQVPPFQLSFSNCQTAGLVFNSIADVVYSIGTPANGSPVQEIDFGEILNGDCAFTVSVEVDVHGVMTPPVYDSLGNILTPAVTNGIGLTYFSPILIENSSCLHTYSLVENGKLTIWHDDLNEHNNDYLVTVTISSDTAITDEVITFTIKYVDYPCSPLLNFDPINIEDEYVYTIGSNTDNLITLDGALNNNCKFSVKVEVIETLEVVQGGVCNSATTGQLFSLNQPCFDIFDNNFPSQYQLLNDAFLTVTYVGIETIVTVKVTVSEIDMWGTLVEDVINDPSLEFKLSIVRDNPCEGGLHPIDGFNNLPESGQIYTYIIGQAETLQIPFTNLDNGQCDYDLEFEDAATGLPFTHNTFTLFQPTLVMDYTIPIQFWHVDVKTQTYPSYIVVSSEEDSLELTTQNILVRVNSNKNIADVFQEEFTLSINILERCEVLFPSTPIQIFRSEMFNFPIDDDLIVLEFSSSQTKYRDYCYTQSTFTAEMVNAQEEWNLAIFTFEFENLVYDSPISYLSIKTDSRDYVGEYILSIKEVSEEANWNVYETQLTVTIIDYCLSATLSVQSLLPEEVLYEAGGSQLYFDLAEIENQFSIDSDHEPYCSPIVFTYSATLESLGSEDEPEENINISQWITINVEGKYATFKTPAQESNKQIVLAVYGQILGEVQLDSKSHQTTIKVFQPDQVEEMIEPNPVPVPVPVFEAPKFEEPRAYQIFEIEETAPDVQDIEISPPQLRILSISLTGLLTLYCDEPLQIPRWPKIEGLTEQQVIQQFPLKEYLNLQIDSDLFSAGDEEIAIKGYNFTQYSSQFIKIQINYSMPNSITLDASSPDELELTIINNSLFRSANGQVPVKKETILMTELKPQLSQEQYETTLMIEKQFVSSLTSVTWSNFGLQLITAYGLKNLWTIVNLLQFAVFLPLWTLNYTELVRGFLKAVKIIAFMEFLPTEWFTDGISDWIGLSDCYDPDDETCTQKIDEAIQNDIALENTQARRLDSADEDEDFQADEQTTFLKGPNLIKAIGIFIAIAALIMVFVLLLFCMYACAGAKYSIYSCYMRLKNKIVYNVFIRFSFQSYLKMLIGSYQTLSLVEWAKSQSAQQGITSIIIICLLLNLPFLYVYVMYRNSDRLDYPSKKEKIGSLYLNVNTDKKSALAYSIVFLIRRCFFVFVTFVLTAYPHLQIQFWIASSVIYMCYLNNSQLFENKTSSRLETFNEALFLGLCYHMVLFSNIIADYETRELIGWSFIYSSIVLVAINIIIIVGINVRVLKNKIHLQLLKKKQAKLIAEYHKKKATQMRTQLDQQWIKEIEIKQSNLWRPETLLRMDPTTQIQLADFNPQLINLEKPITNQQEMRARPQTDVARFLNQSNTVIRAQSNAEKKQLTEFREIEKNFSKALDQIILDSAAKQQESPNKQFQSHNKLLRDNQDLIESLSKTDRPQRNLKFNDNNRSLNFNLFSEREEMKLQNQNNFELANQQSNWFGQQNQQLLQAPMSSRTVNKEPIIYEDNRKPVKPVQQKIQHIHHSFEVIPPKNNDQNHWSGL